MKSLILFLLTVFFFVGALAGIGFYVTARYRINKLGLDAGRQPLEGNVAVRGIRTVAVGQLLGRAALAQYLDAAGYKDSADEADTLRYSLTSDGGLALSKDTAGRTIRFHWKGQRIEAIKSGVTQLEAIEIQSPIVFELHDRDGDLKALFSRRQFLANDAEVKGSLLPALLMGTEDRDFLTNGGVAPKSLIGAVLDGLKGDKRIRGGGTISMQATRTLIWPDLDPGRQTHIQKAWRKVNEFFLASALEQKFNKDDILRTYVNAVDCGSVETTSGRSYALRGFKAAAKYLFGVDDLRKLTLAQAATLVAILPGPNWYLHHPDMLEKRRSTVLGTYAQDHPERAGAVDAAKKKPLGIVQAHDDDEANGTFGFYLDAWRHSVRAGLTKHGELRLAVDPELQLAAESALRDNLTVLRYRIGAPVQGALVALDPKTGQVRALVGGDRFPETNNARMAFRTGSIVKPLYVALALAEGAIHGKPLTPVSLLDLSDCSVDSWTPNDGELSGYITAREALARSSDCGAVVMAKSIGLERACEAIKHGLRNDPMCSGPALIGGARGSEATPLHMAEAYTAFVNGGNRVEANFTNEETKGEEVNSLFSPQAAFQEVQLMRSVMGDAPAERATGAMARKWSGLSKNAEVAGKTGTDTANKFWIAAVQPHLVVIVLISVSNKTTLRERDGFTGGMIAGHVWADFVKRSSQRSPYYFSGKFLQPSGVTWLEVDRTRGCVQLGTADREIFLLGRVPQSCY